MVCKGYDNNSIKGMGKTLKMKQVTDFDNETIKEKRFLLKLEFLTVSIFILVAFVVAISFEYYILGVINSVILLVWIFWFSKREKLI